MAGAKKIKTYDISKVLAIRKKIIDSEFVRTWLNVRLTGDAFYGLAEAINNALSANIELNIITRSIEHLAGVYFTNENLQELAWRFAGNLDALRKYSVVPVWDGQAAVECVPVQIIATEETRKNGRSYTHINCLVLAGSPAGLVIRKRWAQSYCRALGRRLGFSAPFRDIPYVDFRQLFGLRFYAKVDPAHCVSGPNFEEIFLTDDSNKIKPDSVYKHNVTLLKLRKREVDVFNCPWELAAHIPCHHCSAGVDVCPAATHRVTYTKNLCLTCQNPAAYFDPSFPQREVCVACHRHRLLHPELE